MSKKIILEIKEKIFEFSNYYLDLYQKIENVIKSNNPELINNNLLKLMEKGTKLQKDLVDLLKTNIKKQNDMELQILILKDEIWELKRVANETNTSLRMDREI